MNYRAIKELVPYRFVSVFSNFITSIKNKFLWPKSNDIMNSLLTSIFFFIVNYLISVIITCVLTILCVNLMKNLIRNYYMIT